MSSSTSNRRDARRNHQRLLREAETLFAERGIEAPLDELAARADVGAGTVYRHFPNRDVLLTELYGQAFARFASELPHILATASAWAAIEQYIERLGAIHVQAPYLTSIVRRVAAPDDPLPVPVDTVDYVPAADEWPGRDVQTALEALVRRAHDDGTLRADATANDINSMATLLASTGVLGGAGGGTWRRQLRIILDGLRNRLDIVELPPVDHH